MMFRCVSEHFANLRHVKIRNTCVSRMNTLFRGTEVLKHPFYSIGPKMMFGCVSEHFANLRRVKRCKLVFRAWMHYFGVPKLWSIHSTPLDPKWCLGVFRAFRLPSTRKKMQTCVSGLNALFRGNEVVKHPFYSVGPKMMFGCVLEHIAYLQYVKRWKTCVSCLNALFQGTEVVKPPFYSIRTKMMFGCVQSMSLTFRM
jgi:hypothetical protein